MEIKIQIDGKLIKIEIDGRKTCPLLPNARTTIEADTTSKSEISLSESIFQIWNLNLKSVICNQLVRKYFQGFINFPLSQETVWKICPKDKLFSEQTRIRGVYCVKYQQLNIWDSLEVGGRLQNWKQMLEKVKNTKIWFCFH